MCKIDMHVDVLNAITRERARIREELMKLSVGYPHNAKHPYVARGEVLAILSENILKAGEEVTDELI